MMLPFDDPDALAESGLRYAITNGDLVTQRIARRNLEHLEREKAEKARRAERMLFQLYTGAGSACVSDDEGLTDHDESPRAA